MTHLERLKGASLSKSEIKGVNPSRLPPPLALPASPANEEVESSGSAEKITSSSVITASSSDGMSLNSLTVSLAPPVSDLSMFLTAKATNGEINKTIGKEALSSETWPSGLINPMTNFNLCLTLTFDKISTSWVHLAKEGGIDRIELISQRSSLTS
ncbi:hypothetical protein WICPIJ_001962 [Wickerhamomyces pijperi]|uniref:Uncharacterized protein n=1 Tax=Wickerhamomyces pijperi TaxID=599730 RepID=A0A9P8TQA5_WICPI|nr:hypothetical protein WICPIJ_001962 [Wickerhamomyces pijperi]